MTALSEQTVVEGANMIASLLLTNPSFPILVYDLGLLHGTRVRLQVLLLPAFLLNVQRAVRLSPSSYARRGGGGCESA